MAVEELKTDFLLGYFGAGALARPRYRSFVEDRLGKESEIRCRKPKVNP